MNNREEIQMRNQLSINELPDIMQVEDVMAFLQIGRSTMYQLLRSGEFVRHLRRVRRKVRAVRG